MTKFGFFMIFENWLNDPEWPGYHKWHLRQVAQTSAKLTLGQSNPGETKTMEATTYTWTRSCLLLESKIQFLQR